MSSKCREQTIIALGGNPPNAESLNRHGKPNSRKITSGCAISEWVGATSSDKETCDALEPSEQSDENDHYEPAVVFCRADHIRRPVPSNFEKTLGEMCREKDRLVLMVCVVACSVRRSFLQPTKQMGVVGKGRAFWILLPAS